MRIPLLVRRVAASRDTAGSGHRLATLGMTHPGRFGSAWKVVRRKSTGVAQILHELGVSLLGSDVSILWWGQQFYRSPDGGQGASGGAFDVWVTRSTFGVLIPLAPTTFSQPFNYIRRRKWHSRSTNRVQVAENQII